MKLPYWTAGAAIAAVLALPGVASAGLLPEETLAPDADPNHRPEVVMSPGGAFASSWMSANYEVALTYKPVGAPADTDVIAVAATNVSNPDIAVNDAGDAIAVFQAQPAGQNYARVYATTRSAGDQGWSAPEIVSPIDSEGGLEPDVAIEPDGDALIAWNNNYIGGQIKSVFRHADGTLEAPQTILGVGGANTYGYPPQVAIDGTGRATVAFADTSVKVASRTAGPDGTYGEAVVVDSGTYNNSYFRELKVHANAAGDTMVSWLKPTGYWTNEIRSVHRDPLGVAFGSTQTVGANTVWGISSFGIGLDGNGDAVALWYGQGNGTTPEGTEAAFYDGSTGAWTADTSVNQALIPNEVMLGVSDNGEAVGTYYVSEGIKTLRRGAGAAGTWSAPSDVSTAGYSKYRPRVVADDQGSAAFMWLYSAESSSSYQWKLRIDDQGAPVAGTIEVPAQVEIGTAADMSAQFTDRLSAVTVDWDFGDGETGTGADVEHTYDELGQQTVTIQATDAAGNAATPVTRTIEVVDTTDPETSITAPVAGTTNDEPVALTFGGTDNSGGALTFECTVDGGTAAACASPEQLSGLGEGEHTVTVAASDAAGNRDETPASVTFTVDRTAPNTSITSAPVGPTNATAPQVSFTSDDVDAEFECSRDGGAFAACTSPATLTALSEGTHTFAVRATDTAGNTDATPAQTTIVVDRSAPSAAITAPANGGKTTDTTPVLSGTAGHAPGDDPVVFYGVWAGSDLMKDPVAHGEAAVASNGTWSVTLPALALGTYTVSICQYDAAINYTYPCPRSTFTVVAPATSTPQPEQKQPDPAPAPPAPAGTPAADPPAPVLPLGQAIAQGARAYSGALAKLGITGLLSRPVPPMAFQAPGAGKARIDLLAPTAQAAAKRGKAKPVVVATGSKTVTAAGTTKIGVKLTAKGRKLLKKSRRSLRLTVKTSFTPKGGKATSVSRKLTLKK